MNKKQLLEIILKKQNKYVDLLWYARCKPKHLSIPGVKDKKTMIEIHHKWEVDQLNGKDSDWQHGFHSGMVAALNYLLTCDDLGLDQADEEFPNLDS